jgi:hypothetical protein
MQNERPIDGSSAAIIGASLRADHDRIAHRYVVFRVYSGSMALTIESARCFLFEHHQAYLGTVMKSGVQGDGAAAPQPYVSAINTVASHDGCLLMQVSRLAVHSQNLLANGACSLLLISSNPEDFQQSPRLSVQGVVREVDSLLADRYLRLFPQSRAYLDLDFYCLAVDIKEARWIEGFARAEWIAGASLRSSSSAGSTPVWSDSIECGLIEQVSTASASALQRLGDVVVAAIDPWGLWLLCEGRPQRLSFDLPVMDPSAIGVAVAEMLGSYSGTP